MPSSETLDTRVAMGYNYQKKELYVAVEPPLTESELALLQRERVQTGLVGYSDVDSLPICTMLTFSEAHDDPDLSKSMKILCDVSEQITQLLQLTRTGEVINCGVVVEFLGGTPFNPSATPTS